MASEIVFVGGGLDSCVVVAATPVEITTAGWYDATYCDSALQLPTSGQVAFYPLDTSGARTTIVDGEACWTHYDQRSQFSPSNGHVFGYWYDSAGFPWVRLTTTGTSWQLQYNSGTGASPVWTNFGTTTAAATTTLTTYDFKIGINSSGSHSVEMYINNAQLISATFTQALFANVASFQPFSTSGNRVVSQVGMGRNRSTVGMKIAYKRPNATGNANAWTGAYTDIAEPANSDADTILTGAAGNDFTFNFADVTVPANYIIGSVFNFARAKNDGVAPNNIKSLCRSGGTTHASTSNLAGMGTGFAGVGMRYDSDPATSAAWSQAGFNSAEWGLRSAT